MCAYFQTVPYNNVYKLFSNLRQECVKYAESKNLQLYNLIIYKFLVCNIYVAVCEIDAY